VDYPEFVKQALERRFVCMSMAKEGLSQAAASDASASDAVPESPDAARTRVITNLFPGWIVHVAALADLIMIANKVVDYVEGEVMPQLEADLALLRLETERMDAGIGRWLVRKVRDGGACLRGCTCKPIHTEERQGNVHGR
jgi:hypothetical protein